MINMVKIVFPLVNMWMAIVITLADNALALDGSVSHVIYVS